MSTPAERVAEYLRQFDRLRDTGGTIHNVHTDPDAEQVTLTSADLHALLTAAQKGPRATLEAAANTMEETIARGDVAEVAAPFEGEDSRDAAVQGRDALYETPAAWLREYAATAAELPVLGYVVAGRDGILHHNLPRPQREAELIRDEWTRTLPEGLDWDYRVVAITELPEDARA